MAVLELVMCEASGEAKKTMAGATSSGCPNRTWGNRSVIRPLCRNSAVMSVEKQTGHTA